MVETILLYSPTKNGHTTSIAFTSPPPPNLLLNTLGEKHPLVKTRSLGVVGVENYRKSFEIEGISSSAVNLHIQYPADQVQLQVTYWLGASGLAGLEQVG